MSQHAQKLLTAIEQAASPKELLDNVIFHIRTHNPEVVNFLNHPKIQTVYPYQTVFSNLLFEAISAGELELIKGLIQQDYYQDKKGEKDKHGWSYLSVAPRYIDREEIEHYLAHENFYDPKVLKEELHKSFSLHIKTCEILISQNFDFDICDLYKAGKADIFRVFAEKNLSVLTHRLLPTYMTQSLSDWEVSPFDKVYQKSASNDYLLKEYIPSILYTSCALQIENPKIAALLENSVVSLFKHVRFEEEACALQDVYLTFFPSKEKELKEKIIHFSLSAPWAIALEQEILKEKIGVLPPTQRRVIKI